MIMVSMIVVAVAVVVLMMMIIITVMMMRTIIRISLIIEVKAMNKYNNILEISVFYTVYYYHKMRSPNH